MQRLHKKDTLRTQGVAWKVSILYSVSVRQMISTERRLYGKHLILFVFSIKTDVHLKPFALEKQEL